MNYAQMFTIYLQYQIDTNYLIKKKIYLTKFELYYI